ncbi:MAG: hypothetical protein KF693_14970 [Nitrospira sp.]|nr:hypothetical protein [Nitrospira sp.]
MNNLDSIVRQALTEFTADVFAKAWWGKEREAVSLFAFGYLIKQCQPGHIFFDPAQVGIEVRVPRPDLLGLKREICKDLVVWSSPGATCWDTDNWPMAVLEWKANQDRVYVKDVEWLVAFSSGRPNFVGYAICLDLEKRNFRLSCTRVQQQVVQQAWLVL